MSGNESRDGDRECELFLAALEFPSARERAVFLDQACAGDPALRNAVEALLRNHQEDAFLETPVLAAPRPAGQGPHGTVVLEVAAERPGDRLGHYRLVQQIGEGGVGTVFMAEQEQPVRRQVAVKVLKPGMDTRMIISRFETERQALAMMDHPSIAKVLDAGTTRAGRPFFVMELVRGQRITEYCDQATLPTEERLRLFIQVCQAIQHAHLKGIIHRDIKPSNVLVSLQEGVALPKVIDFGIAKALDQQWNDRTYYTEYQAFIGTPAYMSPEQAELGRLDIDTRTDVYSLGVLLYELLTGCTPFDGAALLASGLDAIRRTLREKEPMPPSARLRALPDAERARVAEAQQSDPGRLLHRLRGDLDAIVLKALEKDRVRRYESASALAMDVQRLLDDEPVVARAPSAVYRLRKLVRRHRLVFGAAAALTLALLGGFSASLWQYLEKSAALQRTSDAEGEQRRLRRVAEAQTQVARRRAYAAGINLAQASLAANNLGRARALLQLQRPTGGQTDLRGWEWRHLWQRCQSDALYSWPQGSNEVAGLAVSADGRWVAVADTEGGLAVWDSGTRTEVVRFVAGGGRVKAAFSPVAPWLAFGTSPSGEAAGRGPAIQLWNTITRQTERELPLTDACMQLAFSVDGSQLAVAAADGQVAVWSTQNPAPLLTRALPGLAQSACVVFSPDLTRVAHGTEGGGLRLVDLRSGHELWNRRAADETVTAIAFSPDGRWLASGAGYVESTIRLWDGVQGIEAARLEGHRTWVSSLVFTRDGQTLLSASGDQTIRAWPVPATGNGRETAVSLPARGPTEGEGISALPRPPTLALGPRVTLRGHRAEVWALALLPDGNRLISGARDGVVSVWALDRESPNASLTVLDQPLKAWRFDPSNGSLLTVDAQGEVRRWPGPAFAESVRVMQCGEGIANAHVAPSGRFVVVGTSQGGLRVADLGQRRISGEWSPEFGRVSVIGFLPGTDYLLTRRLGEDLPQVWDLAVGAEVRSWLSTVELGPRSALGFSADGRWAFLLDAEGSARLRNLSTGDETLLDLGLRQIAQVAFSPNGGQLAVVSRSGTAGVWETLRARRVASFSGFLQGMHAVTFAPDGLRLAVGGDGQEAVKLWDTADYVELLTLEGRGSGFETLAFSLDGRVLAGSNGQGLLHLWRAPLLAEIDR